MGAVDWILDRFRKPAYSLRRDSSQPLEFRGTLLAQLERPWSENQREDTYIGCRVAIYRTSEGGIVAAQSRENRSPMIKNPKFPDEIFYKAQEFDSVDAAKAWILEGPLKDEERLISAFENQISNAK
jgi:hypothetical protein